MEQIRYGTLYGLCADYSSKNTLSNCGNGTAELILRMKICSFKKIVFWPQNIWKFFRISVAILEHIKNTIGYRLYDRGSGIAELILCVSIFGNIWEFFANQGSRAKAHEFVWLNKK